MGYYLAGRGDFYRSRGRGDPGFFSFIGKALSTVGGFVPVVGGALQKAGGLIEAAGAHSQTIAKATEAASQIVSKGSAIVKAHPVITAAGAAGLGGLATGVAAGKMTAHPSAAGMGAGGRVRGGGGKRRRMRVTNIKALKRAIRRADGFRRVAMKCIRLTHPQKKARFGGFKYHRKRKRAA